MLDFTKRFRIFGYTKRKKIMKTLALTRTRKGHYENRAGDLRVEVGEFTKGTWTGFIEKKSRELPDFDGNMVEMFDELFKWSASTKREVVKTLTRWAEDNL